MADALKLKAPPNKDIVQVRVDVRGILDPLFDNRVPALLESTCKYRRCEGVALFDMDGGWRIVFKNGKATGYMPDVDKDEIFYSETTVSISTLDKLASAGGVLAQLFSEKLLLNSKQQKA
jgi:hypothetical protein